MTTRLIIDCDTGTDDAVAIMLAALHPELELIAVSTTHGNVPLTNTTENTLRVLDHIGSSVPVFPGAERPLLRTDLPVPRVIANKGNTAFQVDYLDLPPSHSTAHTISAAQMIINTFMNPANTDVVLVAIGPLTNVAHALIEEPRLARRISRLVIMGGAHTGGNITPAAEFNFWADPEAADYVLSAGIRDVVIMPLDATHSAPLTLADCDVFDSLGTPAALATSKFTRHRITHDGADFLDPWVPSAPVHDPLCIAYLIRPEVITSSARYPVFIETRGEKTLGEMLVDTRPWRTAEGTATVAFAASHEVLRDVLLEAFRIDTGATR